MSTLYFHAGMNKTGSSAVQSYLHRNRKRLPKAGLAYPSLPAPNHSSFLQAEFGPHKADLAHQLMDRHGSTRADLDAFRAAFDAFLAASASKGLDVIVSAEATMKLGHEGYTELHNLALASFDAVVVVALVRPPLSFARSAMQQRLKGGLAVSRFENRPPAPEYARRFQPLIDVFGAANVRLRMFHRDSLVAGDALQTVLAMTDGDRSALQDEQAPRSNVSISMEACKALALINGTLNAGRVPAGTPAALADRLASGALSAFFEATDKRRVQQLPPHIGGPVLGIRGAPFRLPHDLARAVLTEHAADIAWMSERMGVDILAFDDPLPPAGSDPFAEWSEPEVAAVGAVFDRINALDAATIAALAERRMQRKHNRSRRALKAATAPDRPGRAR